MDPPALCGATGSVCSVERLIIVISRDEGVDWGTPLTGILNHNIKLPLSLIFFFTSSHTQRLNIWNRLSPTLDACTVVFSLSLLHALSSRSQCCCYLVTLWTMHVLICVVNQLPSANPLLAIWKFAETQEHMGIEPEWSWTTLEWNTWKSWLGDLTHVVCPPPPPEAVCKIRAWSSTQISEIVIKHQIDSRSRCFDCSLLFNLNSISIHVWLYKYEAKNCRGGPKSDKYITPLNPSDQLHFVWKHEST